MALRSSWEGFLRLNLISVPVKAYSATQSGRGRIGFHQIHEPCKSRIRYQKVCPVHGEVTMDEIVSGYEVAKGQYVLIKPGELKELKVDADRAIDIDVFIHPDDLDPIFYTDRSYYLAPDGKGGQKPYAVLQNVMAEDRRYAVATIVMSGREQMVLLRPTGQLITMTMLSFHNQIKSPKTFEDDLADAKPAAEEIKLARTLIDTTTAKKFDFAKYEDAYSGKIMKLIERRASGKRAVAVHHDEEPPAIINLMDALKQSLNARHSGNGKHRGRAGARSGKRGRATRAARRRKTG
jgi:DNA end-binding protein Ku